MAGAVEIADAYVALYVKAPGIEKDIENQLAGASGAGAKPGQSIGDNILAGMGGVLKAGVIGLGAVAATGLGTALVKGFQRLDALDQAEAKLSGLGHSAQSIETIMDSALASVKGTAFGMGDAATVAASTVAAGVEPGKDLERTLKLVGDAATIAGTDMFTMGSIVNKVATSDMMQMDVANQLMDAGIPILQMVADELGVTADEARKMASAGEVSFETFQNALETGLGGAALESGSTFQGAMDNVMASLGRLGEGLLGGVFEGLKGNFGDLTTVLDDLQPTFADIGEKIGDFAAVVIPAAVDGLKNMVSWLSDLGQWIQDNETWLGPLAVAIGAAAAAFVTWHTAIATWNKITTIAKGVQAAFNAVMAANPIMLVIMAIAALVAGLIYFFTQTELGQEVWENITQFIGDAITWLWEDVLEPTFKWIGEAVTNVGNFFTWLWEEAIQPALQAIGDFFTWIYDNIILPVITAIMLQIGLWAALFEWLWEEAVQPALQAIGDFFAWLWEIAIQPVIDSISAGLQAVGDFFTWLWEEAVQPAFQAIGDFFTWLYETVVQPVFDSIADAINTVGEVFTWLYENAVKPAFDGISSAFTWVYENTIKPVADFINDAIDGVGSTVEDTFGGISDFVGNAFQAVLDVVKGPINGFIDLINGIIEGLNSIEVDIPDWVPMVGGQKWGLNIPTIPRLAEGGIVQARPGGILANVGEGKYDEAVIPLDDKFYSALRGGGPSIEVHVHAQPGMSEETVGVIAANRVSAILRG